MSYTTCQAKPEIDNLKRWQGTQNGHLAHIDESIDTLSTAEAERRGAANMLKWIIGVVGFTGLISIAGLFVGLFTG